MQFAIQRIFSFCCCFNLGSGYLTILIGSLLSNDDKTCDFDCAITKFCDPYVQIVVNGKIEYETRHKVNAIGWNAFDEIYATNRIPEDSTVEIRILDNSYYLFNNVDKVVFSKEIAINSLVENYLIDEDNYKLTYNAIWRDEYEDDDQSFYNSN